MMSYFPLFPVLSCLFLLQLSFALDGIVIPRGKEGTFEWHLAPVVQDRRFSPRGLPFPLVDWHLLGLEVSLSMWGLFSTWDLRRGDLRYRVSSYWGRVFGQEGRPQSVRQVCKCWARLEGQLDELLCCWCWCGDCEVPWLWGTCRW